MPGDSSKGKKQSRKTKNREPYKGYYLIYVDTEKTEENYLNGIKNLITDDTIVIKVKKTTTKNLVDECYDTWSQSAQLRIPWIVFDKDKVINFDEIIRQAENKKIQVAWSNPCIEIWFSCYFNEMKNCIDSVQCCKNFEKIYKEKTNKKYNKEDKKIYQSLIKFGNEEKAIKKAKQRFKQIDEENNCNKKYSDYSPCTTMYLLVEELKRKISESEKNLK